MALEWLRKQRHTQQVHLEAARQGNWVGWGSEWALGSRVSHVGLCLGDGKWCKATVLLGTKSLKLDPFLLLDWLNLAWGGGTDGPFVSAVIFPSGRLSLPILKPRLACRTEGVTGGTHQSPG